MIKKKQYPVYVFAGFLESGKTKFIKDTLLDPGFTEDEKTLIVCCEEGEEEYDDDFLKKTNSVLLPVESKEDFKGAKLKKAVIANRPDRIILEYNGMWELKLMEQEFPADWDLYQIVTTVNAETYKVYLQNMGPRLIEHVGASELVVFNRCTPELNEYIRSTNVKAMNPRAMIFLEDINGKAEDYSEGMPLPFDIDAPVIEIQDNDFGTWYIDAANDPEKYEGKTVKIKAQLHRRKEDAPDRFIAGRFAMVCCADDISFLAFYCVMDDAASKVQEEGWAEMTAEVHVEFVKEFRDNAPVLFIKEFKPCKPLEDDLLYFR